MKVKKVVAAVLAMSCATFAAVALGACSDKGDTHEHVFSEEWTQSTDGTKHFHKCTVDGCSVVSGSAEHDYGEPQINSVSTCVTEGSETYTCGTCNYTKTVDLPLADHSWSKWTVAEEDAPTADKEGKATRVCTTSGCTAAAETLEIPTLSRGTFTQEVITPATCTAHGVTKYTYTEGENSVSFNVETEKPHEYQAEINWAYGFPETATVTCKNCNEVSVSLTRANGEITDVYEAQQANCLQDGFAKRTATIVYDGQIMTEVHMISETPQTDHRFTIYVGGDKVPTKKLSSNETQHYNVCWDCGTKEAGTEADHDYVNNVKSSAIIKRATATEQGEEEIECACGHKKVFKFDGVTGESCDVTFTENEDNGGAALTETGGKYYYLKNRDSIYLNFANLSGGVSNVAAAEIFYEQDGRYIPAVGIVDRTDQPMSADFMVAEGSAQSKFALRFFPDGSDESELKIKALIYVTDKSVAVEKELTFSLISEFGKPQGYTYSEKNYDYVWADLADASLFVGQEYQISARGYNVTVAKDGGEAQTITLDDSGVGSFVPEQAGEYVISLSSLYVADTYTVKLTVEETPDLTTLFSGAYSAGDYTVTFGEANAITVSKEGADNVNLTYTYSENVFATTGSDVLSVQLAPNYKLILLEGDTAKAILARKGISTDEIYNILGGTSWSKLVASMDGTFPENKITISITFNSDGTGVINEDHKNWFPDFDMDNGSYQLSFNFTYTAEQFDEYYKLNFVLADGDYSSHYTIFNEIGVGTKGENDLCYINKDSRVVVDGSNVSLSLHLLTGSVNLPEMVEQDVLFDKVEA